MGEGKSMHPSQLYVNIPAQVGEGKSMHLSQLYVNVLARLKIRKICSMYRHKRHSDLSFVPDL